MANTPPGERIKERIPTLTNNAEEFKALAPGECNDFGPWSALKLIVHMETVGMYSKVISGYFDDFYYVDAMAGSGISEYNDGEQCFMGSPLLAPLNAAETFTKMYFIEFDPDRKDALEKRLDYLFEESKFAVAKPESGYDVINADANNKLPELIDEMEEQSGSDFDDFHTLAFIDNEGPEKGVKWNAIDSVAERSDFLINFPTSGIIRNDHNPDLLGEFIGDFRSKPFSVSARKHYLGLYQDQLRSVRKTKQVNTHVRSGNGGTHYDVIYATRKTNSGSEYANAVDWVSDFVEDLDGADVDSIIKVLNNDQEELMSFIDEDDLEDPDPQSTIGDYNE